MWNFKRSKGGESAQARKKQPHGTMVSFFGLSLSLFLSLSLVFRSAHSRGHASAFTHTHARTRLRLARVYVRIPRPVPSVLTHYLLPSTLPASPGTDDADAASFDEAQGLGIRV